MTTALVLRREPWAVEDPVLDCAIFILDTASAGTVGGAAVAVSIAQVARAWSIFGFDPGLLSAERAEWLVKETARHPGYSLSFNGVAFYSNLEFRKWVTLL